MKVYTFSTISILVVLVSIFAQSAYAAGVMVSWAENSESDIAGYRVYYGTASRDYVSSLDAGNYTSIEIDDLNPGGTYYISVTAYDTSGNESDYSEEIQVTVPAESNSQLSPGTDTGGGGGGGGGCFISTSHCDSPDSLGKNFMTLAGLALIGVTGLLRKYTNS